MNFKFWNWRFCRQTTRGNGVVSRRKRRQGRPVAAQVQVLESRVVLSVTIADATVAEPSSGQAAMVFTLSRTGDLTQSVGVAYQTQDGTAKAGVDYVASSGTAYFGINNSTTTISVPVLSNPNITGPESFTMKLTGLVDNPPSFTGVTSFPAVGGADSVAVSDLNGDGKPDVVVGGSQTTSFAVLFNNTTAGSLTPNFSAAQTFSPGGRPAWVATADLNGDGKPDIITANYYSSNLSIYINETTTGASTINLLSPIQIPGGGASSLVVTDVNGDGKPDIVDMGNSNVNILINTTPTGATVPTFAPLQSFPTTLSIGRRLLVTDLNGDGRPDIAATALYGQAAMVMMNTTTKGSSTASFAAPVYIPTGNLSRGIASGDLTGDGQQDIAIVSANDETVTVFPDTTSNGVNSFTYGTPIVIHTQESSQSISIADVNGDGKPDLIVGAPNQSHFLVYPNTTPAGSTTPTFGTAVQIASGSGPYSFQALDFNDDGITDLAYANSTSDTVSIALGDSLTIGKSTATGTISVKSSITAPASASVNQGATLAFTGANAISVTDLSGTAEQMTLTVSHGTLALGATTGLSVSGNGTATLTLTGALASLNGDLPSLVYTPTALYYGTDTLSLSNKDTSNGLTATKNVALAVNPLAPTITAPAIASVNQGATLAFTGANAISVADPSGTTEQLTLTVSQGTLALGTTTGLSVTGSETASLTLTGTLASLNSDLASLVYTPAALYHGADTLSLSDEDTTDNLTGTKSVALTVNALAPTITAPASASVTSGADLAFTGANAISVADPSGTAEQLTLTVGHGTLALGTTTGLSVTGSGTASLTLTGPLASLNGDLSSLIYTPTALYHGADTLSLLNKDTSDGLTGTKSVALTVIKANTASVVSSTGTSVAFGQPVTIYDTVQVVGPGAGIPTGTVTFYDGNTAIGTGTLKVVNNVSVAAITTSSLLTGTHSITAVYAGDSNFNTSTSQAFTQTVTKAGTSSVVTSTSGSVVYGQSVTIFETVGVVSPGAGIPTGTATFYDGNTAIGTGILKVVSNVIVASLSTSSLTAGTHSITAVYAGDANFSASTSAVFTQTVTKADTSSVVSSTSASVLYGQSVTIYETVGVASPGAGIPTGTATFYDGSTAIGTGTLKVVSNVIVAALTTSSLSTGTHSITAVYTGDSNFNGSTSQALTQTVTKAGTSSVVSSTSASVVYGQSVTIYETVGVVSPGAGIPTGTASFYDGNTAIGTGTLKVVSNMIVASLTTSSLSAGTHSITAVYAGDSNFNGSTSQALTQTVTKTGTSSVVSSTSASVVDGQSVTIYETVGVLSPGAGIPTGTVTFYDRSTAIGTGTLKVVSNVIVAALTTSSLSAGTHSITAIYAGDSNFNGSTSAVFTQTVTRASTLSVVSSTPASIVYGQSVTIYETVGVVSPGAGIPTGTVTFFDGSTAIGTGTLKVVSNVIVAALTTPSLSAGTHSITALYTGDSNFNGSTSQAFTQTVTKAGTISVVSSTSASVVYGQPVTIYETVGVVSPGAGIPTGTATFYDGSTAIGTGTLKVVSNVIVAALTTSSLSTGTHSITAVYAGDSNFNGSNSAVLTQTVTKASTSSVVSSSSTSSVSGQPVTFYETVGVLSPGAGIPTGTVTFYDGNKKLGTATLKVVDGVIVAAFKTSKLAIGKHVITAVYSGDSNFYGSTSQSFTQIIKK